MALRTTCLAGGIAAALIAVWAAAAAAARADVILIGTYTASASQPAPDKIDAALVGPNGPGGGLLEGPVAFVTGFDAALKITLSGAAGHGFEAILDGIDLGAGALFAAFAATGPHVLDVWDYTLTGTPLPGGGILASSDDSRVIVTIDSAPTKTPEPAMAASLGLAALGLTAWGFARRRA